MGDLDGDGHLDIVRTDMWFQNMDGDGSRWVEHAIGPNTPPPPDFQPHFAWNATKAMVVDVNGDGRLDVVSKPWRAQPGNAVQGRTYVVFLENAG